MLFSEELFKVIVDSIILFFFYMYFALFMY